MRNVEGNCYVLYLSQVSIMKVPLFLGKIGIKKTNKGEKRRIKLILYSIFKSVLFTGS